MDRRTVLAGIGMTTIGSAGIATALGAFDPPPYILRATRADGDETDVTCELPTSVVDEYRVLADVLSRARKIPADELATRDIEGETAAAITSSLNEACERTGGLYFYDNQPYFISIRARNPKDAHGDHGHSH